MTLARYNIRLPAALDKSLRTLAEREGISAYATLQRCVKAGIAAQANPPTRDVEFGEIVSELASVSTVKRRSKGTPDRRRRGTPFSDNMMLVC